MEVDHDRQVVHTETLGLAPPEPEVLLAAMRPSEEHVASRLTSPIVSTHLDTRNVAFERLDGVWLLVQICGRLSHLQKLLREGGGGHCRPSVPRRLVTYDHVAIFKPAPVCL